MNRKGFTLIEVLLALFITAILITILSVVFNTGLRSYRQGKDLLEITRKAQLILGQMTRDLRSAMVQDGVIPFQGDGSSIFFMAPIAEVDDETKTDLAEVGYKWDISTKELKRHYVTYGKSGYDYPNEVDYNNPTLTIMCEGVEEFKIRYRPVDSNWMLEGRVWTDWYKLPEMVEVSITIQGEFPKNAPKQKKTFTTWIYIPNSSNNP